MLRPLSDRLLTLLQLTRMALVFTAISNGAAEVLLRAGAGPVDPLAVLSMAAVSVGLYGFGMSLNDIIDRRRDGRIAPHRPLPSGRVHVVTAHALCVCLALLAGWGAAAYAHATGDRLCFVAAFATGVLILFYDGAGKYLVALGLLSLGMIRFGQAAIAAPTLPVVWHPVLLLTHVAVLSAVCYHWEEKRPPLTPKHWGTVLGGVVGLDVGVVGLVAWRRGWDAVGFGPGLVPPAAAAAAFVALAVVVRRRAANGREAGQKLMLYGLLWLIVYDAAFVAGYVGWAPAVGLLALLPVAWGAVQLMRWWSKVVALSQRPAFQRAKA